MTRINCIPPQELTDKHLIAEYRELPRVFRLAREPKPDEKFPDSYTLGPGHVKFFYTRLDYIFKRYYMLVKEMYRRGFQVSYPHPAPEILVKKKISLFNSWDPTPEAMALNRKRIEERLNEKK